MSEVNRFAMKASLQDAISSWLCSRDDDLANLCYIGPNTAEHMASAAFGVLEGMADLEEYFKQEGKMK